MDVFLPMAQGRLTNPYSYVSNNPLTSIDPLGLYQIDVHYYMTYFLAITAGVDKDKARLIALATQYIDENRATSPTPDGVAASSMTINQAALDRYHFVEYGYDTPRTLAQSLYKFTFSRDSDDYIANRIKDPASPQLARLLAASNFAKTDRNATCNSSAQLFGEYLHAFEDTFAHRDQDNEPYSAETAGYGTGHLFGGENPDYTYNHFSGFPGLGGWNNNEARTLEMEIEVFNKLGSLATTRGASKGFKKIENILKQFNSFHASDKDIDNGKFAAKIAILNNGLKALGYREIDMSYGSLTEGFDVNTAASNRNNALERLNPQDYVGTILPKGMAALPTKKSKYLFNSLQKCAIEIQLSSRVSRAPPC